jgi:hypothetical protein
MCRAVAVSNFLDGGWHWRRVSGVGFILGLLAYRTYTEQAPALRP